MDDQSLELFNLISILKKVTKKQEILQDIKNLETEIIDLNYSGNNSYKISLRICKIWNMVFKCVCRRHGYLLNAHKKVDGHI